MQIQTHVENHTQMDAAGTNLLARMSACATRAPEERFWIQGNPIVAVLELHCRGIVPKPVQRGVTEAGEVPKPSFRGISQLRSALAWTSQCSLDRLPMQRFWNFLLASRPQPDGFGTSKRGKSSKTVELGHGGGKGSSKIVSLGGRLLHICFRWVGIQMAGFWVGFARMRLASDGWVLLAAGAVWGVWEDMA